jgi:hypothetical protein
VLAAPVGPGLAAALSDLGPRDAAVLWLRPADLAELKDVPVSRAAVYVSTYLGSGESAPLPPGWRDKIRLVYPYELPDKRIYNMATFHSWIALRNLPLVDEGMQSEVFFSVGYLMFTMTDMLDNLYRDCLIDRGETMVRKRELLRAEEETLIRQGGHPPVPSVAARSHYAPGPIFGTDPHGKLAQTNTPMVGQREGTTIYPHLALAAGQRFASKGAYIVHFAAPTGQALAADSDWLVP